MTGRGDPTTFNSNTREPAGNCCPNVTDHGQLTGIITGTDVIASPLVQGRLEKLLVDEGSEVKKGQLIAEIDPDRSPQLPLPLTDD